MQVDLLKYADLKKRGSIVLHKLGGTKDGVDGTAVLFVQKFDPSTGETLMPDMGPINLAEILATRAQFQAQVDGLNALLADMKTLGVPTELPKVTP